MRRFPIGAFHLIAAGAALLLVIRLGAHPLLDPDEARFARTSVEMMRSGDVVVPTFEGVPRLEKPPLLHWIHLWLFRWMGPTAFAARLPSAVATFVSLLLVAWIARRRFGEDGALWSAVIFVTMPLALVLGRAGNLDALLAVHVLAALALDLAAPRDAGAYRAAAIGALIGLGFLVKGPVAIVLTLLVMLAGRTAAGLEVAPTLRGATGWIAGFSVVVLPWALAFVERVGLSETVELIRHEVFGRYFGGTAHIEPPWYYAKIAVLAFAPWVGPIAVGAARSLFSREDSGTRTARYAAAGLIAGLLFFSLGRGKLPNYILSLAPLAALVATWELGQELAAPRERRLGPGLVAAWLVALAVAVTVLGPRLGEPHLAGLAAAGGVVLGAGAVAALVGVGLSLPRLVYGSTAATMGAFYVVAIIQLAPLLGEARSAQPLVRSVPALSSGRPIAVVATDVPSLTFYLDRIPEKVRMPRLASRLDRNDGALYVVSDTDLRRIPQEVRARLREVGRAGDHTVFEAVPREPADSGD